MLCTCFPALHGQLITSLMFSLLDLIKPFNAKSCVLWAAQNSMIGI